MLRIHLWLASLAALCVPSVLSLTLNPLGTWNITSDIQGSYRLNGVSFQEDALTTFGNYQYVTFYNTSDRGYGNEWVNVGRRVINPSVGPWQYLTLKDYYQTTQDGHNIISMGISGDGRIHLSFDHHDTILKYRATATGVATNPPTTWSASLFGAVQNSLPGSSGPFDSLTYPRFETLANGDMLMEFRIGASGAGDSYLHRYTQQSGLWSPLGMYLQGQNNNAYINGLDSINGRLSVSYTVRETPDANTNHDLYYVYSDDNGVTFHSTNGTLLRKPVTPLTPGAKFWNVSQNSQMVNQEGQVMGSDGRFHVLMRDALTGTSMYYHYLLDTTGNWSKRAINVPDMSPPLLYNNRGKMAVDKFGKNLIALLPDDPKSVIKVYGSTPQADFQDWTLLATIPNTNSEPLYDRLRLSRFNVLSLFIRQAGPYPQRQVQVWDYALQ